MSSPNPAEITGLSLLQNLVKEHEDKILSLTELIDDLRIRLNETEDELRSRGLLPEPPDPYENCDCDMCRDNTGSDSEEEEHGSL